MLGMFCFAVAFGGLYRAVQADRATRLREQAAHQRDEIAARIREYDRMLPPDPIERQRMTKRHEEFVARLRHLMHPVGSPG
jgi:hypothetical protein